MVRISNPSHNDNNSCCFCWCRCCSCSWWVPVTLNLPLFCEKNCFVWRTRTQNWNHKSWSYESLRFSIFIWLKQFSIFTSRRKKATIFKFLSFKTEFPFCNLLLGRGWCFGLKFGWRMPCWSNQTWGSFSPISCNGCLQLN